MSHGQHASRGFSLLEVIIATGILATSTVLLLNVFSTGERHSRKAEEQLTGQMLCQTELDQVLADPSALALGTEQPLESAPGWRRTIEVEPLEPPGLVQVRIAVSREPTSMVSGREPRAVFELTRWALLRDQSEASDPVQHPFNSEAGVE